MPASEHVCAQGPACPNEIDMGRDSSGRRVIVVDDFCDHESCNAIRDRAAYCGECMSDCAAEEELLDELERTIGEGSDDDDG